MLNKFMLMEAMVSREHDSSQVTITLNATGILDLRAMDVLHRIHNFARNYKATHIIIDLKKTHRVHDSGLAMLLILNKSLGQQVSKIKLINSGHMSNSHLALLPAAFEID